MNLKKQILVIEDNFINREMLTDILSERYTVLQAENGREGLDILNKNKDSIALILLDVMMPVMDGYTFLDKVKEDNELALIPVIVMTQGSSEEDEVSALEHGATDFVPKPYRPRVVLNRIESLIKLRETSAIVNQFQYDRLTGLYSKEFFYNKVRERLNEDSACSYSIVCSDIENFKLYNDTFGRESGDRLLCSIAKTIKRIIGENGICSRYRADCFLVLKKTEDEREARRRFFDEKSSNYQWKSENVSVKWGVYEISDCSIPVEQMCDRAWLAANSIKGQYDKCLAVYDDELRSKMLREKAVTDAMEKALTEEQFEIYLQPKYSLKDNCMIGAEALVRWIHPEWGFMSPGEFIPLFEKNGFIPKLDRYVWERVCAKLKDWQESRYAIPVISVNVSRADIYQFNLVDTLLEITQKYGIDPAYLHLEITESAYSENPNQIISTVEDLRKCGFIIEMDDFGSGYSSLNMLSRMNLDILKLDMKFIQNEISKHEDQSILNDIINMAHRIHLSVVAEGIETSEQMKRLQSVGCDYVQGYFFAKPMPVSEFEELWNAQTQRPSECFKQKKRDEISLPTLLAADEDDEYRDRIKRTFEGEYRVLEANDSESAAEIVRECAQNEIFAVIMSTTLPNGGAESLLKMMRREPAFWNIPVLAAIPYGETMECFKSVRKTDDFICKRHPMFDLKRRVERLLDIMILRKRELDLKDEASRDYLTDLLNRRGLQAAMESLRAEDFPLAICLFDLDDLKAANDTYGHETGDKMLRVFGEQVRRLTRAADIRCRYGGDEFAVILKHIKDAETVMKKCETICREFRSSLERENLSYSCSCGIAVCETDEVRYDNLIEQADKALYRSKAENKGGCCLWEGAESCL